MERRNIGLLSGFFICLVYLLFFCFRVCPIYLYKILLINLLLFSFIGVYFFYGFNFIYFVWNFNLWKG